MKAKVRILEGKHLDVDQIKLLKTQARRKLQDFSSNPIHLLRELNTHYKPGQRKHYRVFNYPEESLMVISLLRKMHGSPLFTFEALLTVRDVFSVKIFRRTPVDLLIKVVTEDPHNSMGEINEIISMLDFEIEKRVMERINITVDIIVKPVQVFRKMLEV